ncbi:MAG TPA: ATP-binding protein [Polyangia bacterium]|jgi:signal transduction histidine kinase
MRRSRSAALSARLALASLGTALAVGVVCAVGLFSLGNASAVARIAVSRQLALIDDAAAMSAFLYQKGFVAEYLLTGNRAWLAELESNRPAFESWLKRMHGKVGGPSSERLLDQIQTEYAAYDHARREAVALYDAGHPAEAKAALLRNHAQAQRLRDLFAEFGRLARADAETTLAGAEQSVRRLADVLVATSVAGAVASLLVGFLWARRITKPITELEVQVESAAERTRIHLVPGRAGLETLGDQVSAIVEKLEETDAALFEHRRRLVQSEKLSAVGELAAKLAHEVLNPLAGMKAATQLLERQGAAAPGGTPVVDTARALDREITRVEGLVRRLMNYARPLAPRFELCTVGSLVDAALEASAPALARHQMQIARREESDLPPLEVDPQLVTQALVNLIVNAAEATPPGGGVVEVEAGRATTLGREEIAVRVRDRGAGIPAERERELFKPFFTTKPEGHGLGLAVSQNILLEHGGRIVAGNRPDPPGAVFELQIPVVR